MRRCKTLERLDEELEELRFNKSVIMNKESDASKKRIMIKAVED
jgi:hypothetical protein